MEQSEYYDPAEVKEVIKFLRPYFTIRRRKKTLYYNVPCAFDIETTSFYENGEKRAIMWMWSFCLYGVCFIGRTWDEFVTMINDLSRALTLDDEKRLIIYVHNLSFEFQFFRKWLDIGKVFALDEREPIYAQTNSGIEFRCSYLLSGYDLATIGKNLTRYKVQKLVGDLDYELLRHNKTPFTEKEADYSLNDVRVVCAYIAERIEDGGGIGKIPLTKTGAVREYCRKQCYGDKWQARKYKNIMLRLTLTENEYRQLKRGFSGGFTHANPFYSGKVVNDVTSYDFTSSYPYVMLSEQFPMLASEERQDITGDCEDFRESLRLYCCLFDVCFTGLQATIYYDNYISISRCSIVEKPVENNGRIVSADRVLLTVTEQDFYIIERFYKWDAMEIRNFRRYRKDYLPRNFVVSILKLYKDKTALKGVDGMEREYLNAKEMLNSCYGMCVTDIVRDEIQYYADDWQEPKQADTSAEIDKYNAGRGRFLFYPWGVWVTAYARKNLFTGICEFAGDYVYSDTDSIKVRNADAHKAYIDAYNQQTRAKLHAAMEYLDIDPQETEPVTKDGVKKPLGVWDFDGHYKRFKTLGAKRYIVEYSDDPRNGKDRGEYKLTVAGLSKRNGMDYLITTYNDPFTAFTEDLDIPAANTGKLTHTYIDELQDGILTDYTGQQAEYHELSSVHLEDCPYHLSLASHYVDYLLSLTI